MILLYLATGAFAGLLAGLFGVGGGLVIVPVLSFIFAAEGFPEAQILHLALGTSLASILFTGFASARAHGLRGALDWRVLQCITPGILIGTFAGSTFAAQLHSRPLTIFFIVFEMYVATQMLLGFRPKPERQLPGFMGLSVAGLGIGLVSSLVGIGGGTLSVPFLTWTNLPLHTAIGTSAAIGLPIALAGTIGYALNGFGVASLPPYSIGFIYLPALLGLVLASMLTAPLGARLAHQLPVRYLKQLFALLLYFLALRMAFALV